MSFEEGLSAHLKSKAFEIDVPEAELTMFAHPPKRQSRAGIALSTVAASVAVVTFGYLLVSGSSTNVANGALPELPVVADVIPAPTFSTPTSTPDELPRLEGFTWTRLPMRSAQFVEFQGDVVVVTEFNQLIISEEGNSLSPLFESTARPWHSWTSDDDTMYAIARPANENEPWLLYYNTFNGPVWTQEPIEFPERTDYVEIIGAVGGDVVVQHGTGWETDPRQSNLRRLLADYHSFDGVGFVTGRDRIYIVESLTYLQVGTIEYELTGMTRAELLDAVGPTLVTPTSAVAVVGRSGTVRDLELDFATLNVYPSVLDSPNQIGLPTAERSLYITDDLQEWEPIPWTYNQITEHEGALYTAHHDGRPGGFAQFVDGTWEEFGPPVEYFFAADSFALDAMFDVGNLGYAAIDTTRTGSFDYTHEFEIEGLIVSANPGREEITITGETGSITYATCCSDQESWVSLREGNLVFLDPETSRELLVIDPFTLEHGLFNFEINEVRTMTLTYSPGGEDWFQMPLSDITDSEWVSDVLVTDDFILIATEDEILVGTPE